MSTFYGKYRGQVQNNLDPNQMGRLQVSCPAVLGDGTLAWAMPCVPYAGSQVGLFAAPPVGANVWVEFEGGNANYPIWAGCFWGRGELPSEAGLPTGRVFVTDGLKAVMNDLPGAGGLTIEVSPPSVAVPLKLAFTSSGIEISCGAASVKLDPATVKINDGALEVI